MELSFREQIWKKCLPTSDVCMHALHVWLYAFVIVRLCACIRYVCIYLCMYSCMYVWLHICMWVDLGPICMTLCMLARLQACMFACMYTCTAWKTLWIWEKDWERDTSRKHTEKDITRVRWYSLTLCSNTDSFVILFPFGYSIVLLPLLEAACIFMDLSMWHTWGVVAHWKIWRLSSEWSRVWIPL